MTVRELLLLAFFVAILSAAVLGAVGLAALFVSGLLTEALSLGTGHRLFIAACMTYGFAIAFKATFFEE